LSRKERGKERTRRGTRRRRRRTRKTPLAAPLPALAFRRSPEGVASLLLLKRKEKKP
jgi:hypothetical protein